MTKMIKSHFLLSTLLCLSISLSLAQKPTPVWPQQITIAFHISGDSGKLNSTAKIWYDYANQLFRTDYDNGADSECYYEFGKKTKCVELYKQNKIYLFSPQQNICCHYQQQKPPRRDFLVTANFTYKGEASLNNETFDLWQSPKYEQNKYYATNDAKQIPRRFALGQLVRDYYVSSYSNAKIDPKIFTIPDYCKKQCNGIEPQIYPKYLQYEIANE